MITRELKFELHETGRGTYLIYHCAAGGYLGIPAKEYKSVEAAQAHLQSAMDQVCKQMNMPQTDVVRIS